MAYPFYPAYQPYGYLPQGYQQMTQQAQAQVQPVQNQTGIVWVTGVNEAQMYPVAPNNAVALWEQSGKTIYLKSADATGKPTLRIYDLVERSETASPALGVSDDKNIVYARKDDVDAISGAIKGILNDIEQMRSDIYGFAGRKKTMKKEVTDDDA